MGAGNAGCASVKQGREVSGAFKSESYRMKDPRFLALPNLSLAPQSNPLYYFAGTRSPTP
jgi:hypothetical protein